MKLELFQGHGRIVKALLKVGADVNAKNIDGDSPLTLAAENGYFE